MKDADYRVRDEDEFEEHVRMRSRHEDRPCKRLKDYAMAFACGVGFGIGIMTFWYEKRHTFAQEQVAEYVAADRYACLVTPKAKKMLDDGFKEISKRYDRWYDGRIWTHLVRVIGEPDEKVPDNNVKKVLDDILSPKTPMGRLLSKYRGPKAVPEPSQLELDQFEELYQEYETYQPVIDALVDWNHDNETTREERNRALYKLFHQ
jgi:hypothetical protein